MKSNIYIYVVIVSAKSSSPIVNVNDEEIANQMGTNIEANDEVCLNDVLPVSLTTNEI